MSADRYFEQIGGVLAAILQSQRERIEEAGELLAGAIAEGNRVYFLGSGHSVIPVMDVFPRYGSFVGFFPLNDPRLMWHNVVGPGGARELLWIERREGYVENFLQSFAFRPEDCMIVFSHGGLNAAPVEATLYTRRSRLRCPGGGGLRRVSGRHHPAAPGIAGDRFQSRYGTVFGILFAVALAGGMALPWLAGQIGGAAGLRWTFVLIAAAFGAVFGLNCFAARFDPRHVRMEAA